MTRKVLSFPKADGMEMELQFPLFQRRTPRQVPGYWLKGHIIMAAVMLV